MLPIKFGRQEHIDTSLITSHFECNPHGDGLHGSFGRERSSISYRILLHFTNGSPVSPGGHVQIGL